MEFQMRFSLSRENRMVLIMRDQHLVDTNRDLSSLQASFDFIEWLKPPILPSSTSSNSSSSSSSSSLVEQAQETIQCLPLLSSFKDAKNPPLKQEEDTLGGGEEERLAVALKIGLPDYHASLESPHRQHVPSKVEVLDEFKARSEAPDCKISRPVREHGYSFGSDHQQKRFWIPTPAQILVGPMQFACNICSKTFNRYNNMQVSLRKLPLALS